MGCCYWLAQGLMQHAAHNAQVMQVHTHSKELQLVHLLLLVAASMDGISRTHEL